MRVVVRTSGAVDLYVGAAPERYVVCPEDDPEVDWERCMEQGVDAYETVFSMRLKEAASAIPTMMRWPGRSWRNGSPSCPARARARANPGSRRREP